MPFFILAAMIENKPPGLVFALLAGSAGIGLYQWGKASLERRRRALHNRTEGQVLRLAAQKGGRITVTDLATALGSSVAEAEALLSTMEDGFRVRSEVSSAGVVYYEFPEIIHGVELTPAPGLDLDGATEPNPANLREDT